MWKMTKTEYVRKAVLGVWNIPNNTYVLMLFGGSFFHSLAWAVYKSFCWHRFKEVPDQLGYWKCERCGIFRRYDYGK